MLETSKGWRKPCLEKIVKGESLFFFQLDVAMVTCDG